MLVFFHAEKAVDSLPPCANDANAIKKSYKHLRNMKRMLLEVCVDSPDAALTAQSCGADRIELCAGLDCGGITPSPGLLQLVRDKLALPLQVLIRPRAGDFCYTEREFETMLRDITYARQIGANGVVCGVLLPDGTIDVARTAMLVEAARPLSFTFHRAFDFARDPVQALESVVDTGADRLLTSGQSRSAILGIPLIRKLLARAKGRIIVMPGGGISSQNVHLLMEKTDATELHLSASKLAQGSMTYRKRGLSLNSSQGMDNRQRRIDPEELKQIRMLTR